MKKLLTTLGLIGMLSGSPKAQAGITPKTEETKKDLIEAIITEQATPEEDGKTITFQEAQKLQEQQKLMEEIMNDEKVQELIKEYGQEDIEKAITEIITSEDGNELMEKLLEDEKIQKALKEGDEEVVTKRVEEIVKEHKEGTFGMKIVNSLPASVLLNNNVNFYR